MRYEHATTEQLSAAIEGVLLISREYERPELLALAQRLGKSLRARRLPNGTFTEPAGAPSPLSPLSPVLSAARAALALMRVDEAPVWPLMVLRALQAAQNLAASAPVCLADWGVLCRLPTSLLLGLSARIENCTPNFDEVSIKRGWHTFAPEAAARDYLTVSASPDSGSEESDPAPGEPVDFLPLVCPLTLQVLLLVLAPGGTAQVTITKNGTIPYVKNLLTGDYDQAAALVPLGDGSEAMIGIFLADT